MKPNAKPNVKPLISNKPNPMTQAVSTKSGMHPRNPHRVHYDFVELCKALPELKAFLTMNPAGLTTINFDDPLAVRCLNRAILKAFYAIDLWQIPEGFLCPPVPGRADYIHHINDLLTESNAGDEPEGKEILGLDIGTGASCIYPIIGRRAYGWRFVASEILPAAFESAATIVESNKILKGSVTCRLQSNWSFIFKGVIQSDERFHFAMCNPPFHTSADEALAATQRKVKGLAKNRAGQKKTALPLSMRPTLASTTASNFGGQQTELWCLGGEFTFIQQMIRESQRISSQVLWFTVLVSKESNLPKLQQMLKQAKACDIRAIDMAQGQKKSRILAWTFVPLDEHAAFFEN